MADEDFGLVAERTLQALEAALDDVDGDFDIDRGDGKVAVVFDDGTHFIINRQSASSQLWLAEPGGGWHFDRSGADWICDKRGVTLRAALAELLSAKLGSPVELG